MNRNRKRLYIRAPRGDTATRILCTVICLCFLGFFAVPIAYVLFSSVVYRGIWSFDGYVLLLNNKLVLNGLKNSVFLACVGTAYSLLLEIPTAYVLAKKRYNALSTLFLSLGQLGVAIMPLYLLLKQLGLLNTLWSLILPCGFSVYYTQLLRARIINAANELEDAASIDGANVFIYIVRILMPTLSSSIGCVAFFHACGYWSNTFYAQTFITDEAKYPLSVVMMELLIKNRSADVLTASASPKSVAAIQMAEFALCVLSTLPLIGIFLLLKKHVRVYENEDGIIL